jgi:hypothetical protein
VDKITKAMPALPAILRANRRFLRRAVRFCVDNGVNQFLDLGSGVPTVGNVHEVALAADPRSRVVYVDIDPIAVAHSRAILEGNSNVSVVQADLRDPETVFADPGLAILDFKQPVALLMLAVLHFLPDSDKPAEVVAQYRARLAPGSYIAVSHTSLEGDADASAAGRDEFNRQPVDATIVTRTPDEIREFFGEFELVEPGLVYLAQWRPDPGADLVNPDEPLISHLAGLARLTS